MCCPRMHVGYIVDCSLPSNPHIGVIFYLAIMYGCMRDDGTDTIIPRRILFNLFEGTRTWSGLFLQFGFQVGQSGFIYKTWWLQRPATNVALAISASSTTFAVDFTVTKRSKTSAEKARRQLTTACWHVFVG